MVPTHLLKLNLILCLCGAPLAWSQASAAPQASFKLDPVSRPLEQKISLRLDPKAEGFSGEVEIKLTLKADTRRLELSGRDYVISSAELSGAQRCALSHSALEMAKVALSCPETLKAGDYLLSIQFTAPYNRKSVGLYKTIDGETPYLFTQFEMIDGRRAFPLYDEPEYKIPFQLTIKAPKGQKVYSNTALSSREESEGWVTHRFKQTKPIPSYLIALAVGPFEEHPVQGTRFPAQLLTAAGKGEHVRYAQANIPAVIEALEGYFEIPYMYEKLDSIAVPEFPFGAMENAGLITYREELLLVNEAAATRKQKASHVNVIAHEIAHQWYGNLVTMRWWDDLWLNEAFASWMADKVTHQLRPEFQLDLRLSQNYVMASDAQVSTKAIRKEIHQESDVMDGLGLAYSKGSAVLAMVENWIGEAAFRRGVQTYLKRHAYKSAEASDLWRALGEASGQDVAAVLSSFIEQPSFPLISVNLKGRLLKLEQRRFIIQGQQAPEQRWAVPVVIKYGKGEQVRSAKVLLKEPSQALTLDFEPEWIFPDQGAYGYYRWLLPDAYFDALLRHVQTALSTRERLSLLEAVSALLDAGTLEAARLMQTLSTFTSDPEPSVAKKAIEQLAMQRQVFKDPSNHALWPKLITLSTDPLIKRYGLKAQEGEPAMVSELRGLMISLRGNVNKDPALIKAAQAAARDYLKDPSSIDPYLAKSYLKLAADHGDEALLKAYIGLLESTKLPQVKQDLLVALGHFGPLPLQREVLEYVLAGKVTASDLALVLSGMRRGEERLTQFRGWFYKHFKQLRALMPPFALPYLPYFVSRSCDRASIAELKEFFSKLEDTIEGAERTLEKLEGEVESCLTKKKAGLSSINRYLGSL